MREFEITTRVTEPLESVETKLKTLGFRKVKTATIDDIYMCPKDLNVTKDNIQYVLSKSALIRYIYGDFYGKQEEYKLLTYKDKRLENGVVISEEKISVNVDSVETTLKLLLAMGYDELVRVCNNYVVYEKEGFELALQSVKDLGLLIEYESESDCDNMSTEEILAIKKDMLKEVKALGIKTTDEYDVKKAYELIQKRLG